MKEAETLGLEVVGDATFTTDTATDFSVQLTQAQQAGADLLFLPIYYTPASCHSDPGQRHGYAPPSSRGRHGRHPDRRRTSMPLWLKASTC